MSEKQTNKPTKEQTNKQTKTPYGARKIITENIYKNKCLNHASEIHTERETKTLRRGRKNTHLLVREQRAGQTS